jgi:hypothetical protein
MVASKRIKENGMLSYQELLDSCTRQLEDEKLADWLVEKHNHANISRTFFINFGLIGRKIPRIPAHPSGPVEAHLKQLNPGFNRQKWTLDDLCRLSLMLSLDLAVNKEHIGTLLAAADMREQVIIYKSLPYLANASDFVWLAIDGIRTNMVDVFDAIALDNIYPHQYFPDDAWNQMVLKAIFMERPMYRILGLDERRSQKLADILYDFVHERWSAGRKVTPELWRLVRGHLNELIFDDLKKVIRQDTPVAVRAAIKAMEESNYPAAHQWLEKEEIPRSQDTWETIGKSITEEQ